MKKALLVIDIDHNDGWGPGYTVQKEEKDSVALAIKEKLAEERANGTLIIFVVLGTYISASGQEAQYSLGDVYIPDLSKCLVIKNTCLVCCMGTRNRLAEFLENRNNSEPVFIEVVNDAFDNKNLEKYLRAHGVDELGLIGCNTNACIKDTATGAIKAGFKVVLHAKASYPLIIKTEADASWWVEDIKRLAQISPDQEVPVSVII